jgi:hypothetical protein
MVSIHGRFRVTSAVYGTEGQRFESSRARSRTPVNGTGPQADAYAQRVLADASAYAAGDYTPTTAVGCAARSPAPAGAGGYTNPFAAAQQLAASRIDQGVDYTGTGPILALGPGRVYLAATSDTGWGNGNGFLAYTLTSGAYQGSSIYIAEGITPTVTAGQTITAGQQIATFNGHSIEIGFAAGPTQGDLALAHTLYGEGADTAAGRAMNQLLTTLGAPGRHRDMTSCAGPCPILGGPVPATSQAQSPSVRRPGAPPDVDRPRDPHGDHDRDLDRSGAPEPQHGKGEKGQDDEQREGQGNHRRDLHRSAWDLPRARRRLADGAHAPRLSAAGRLVGTRVCRSESLLAAIGSDGDALDVPAITPGDTALARSPYLIEVARHRDLPERPKRPTCARSRADPARQRAPGSGRAPGRLRDRTRRVRSGPHACSLRGLRAAGACATIRRP